ncbi:trp operon leader peptide [Escherichia coli]|nr:trp operon leader peptide [Escherichia coli]EEX9392197.1 trp operon leader peptide [Escherichia coli]
MKAIFVLKVWWRTS